LHQGVADVVGIADIGQPDAGQAAHLLLDRQQIGHGLAGMQEVRETIDHRNAAVARQVLDIGMRIRARHDAIQIPAEHACGVRHCFAAMQLQIGAGKKQRRSPQLRHSDFERHARARRVLLEDHPESSARKQRMRLPHAQFVFQLHGEPENGR
jgi:hypothetical protein